MKKAQRGGEPQASRGMDAPGQRRRFWECLGGEPAGCARGLHEVAEGGDRLSPTAVSSVLAWSEWPGAQGLLLF